MFGCIQNNQLMSFCQIHLFWHVLQIEEDPSNLWTGSDVFHIPEKVATAVCIKS